MERRMIAAKILPPPSRSRARRLLALGFAPAVMPVLSMYRYNYMLNQPLKFWQSVLMYALFSYVASALAGLAVLLSFKLLKRQPVAWEVVIAFVLGSGALALATSRMFLGWYDPPAINDVIFFMVVSMICGLVISATYCAVAGVPWRGAVAS
jgi:hypothetical protein